MGWFAALAPILGALISAAGQPKPAPEVVRPGGGAGPQPLPTKAPSPSGELFQGPPPPRAQLAAAALGPKSDILSLARDASYKPKSDTLSLARDLSYNPNETIDEVKGELGPGEELGGSADAVPATPDLATTRGAGDPGIGGSFSDVGSEAPEFLGLSNGQWGAIAQGIGILAQLTKQSQQAPQVISPGGGPPALPLGQLGQVSVDVPRLGIASGGAISQPAVNTYAGAGQTSGILAQLQKLGSV